MLRPALVLLLLINALALSLLLRDLQTALLPLDPAGCDPEPLALSVEIGRRGYVGTFTSLWMTRRFAGAGSFEKRPQERPDSSPT